MEIYLVRHTKVALTSEYCYGISDVELAESQKKDDYSLLSGACLMFVIISAFLFGVYSNDTKGNLYPVQNISLLMFIITLILAIAVYKTI